MLETILGMVSVEAKLLPDEIAAYNALKAFIASSAGQDISTAIATLFSHSPPTQGSAVVVEPKATLTRHPVNMAGQKPIGIA